jgi:sortase B
MVKGNRSGRLAAAVALLCIALGVGMAAWGAFSIAKDVGTVMRYRSVSAEWKAEGEASEGIDWDGLRQTNADVGAWVSVSGTDIDYPVCQAGDDDPEHYLYHDLWGNYELAGCPYIDHRANADGAHVMVFGHHMNVGGMFSDVYQCYRQEEFDRVLAQATLTWSTPASGDIKMRPVCAMSVDKTYEDIQWFEFDSVADMKEWLRDLDGQATAHAEGREATIETADRVVTLVTCSSMLGGQRERTLVVFAGSI